MDAISTPPICDALSIKDIPRPLVSAGADVEEARPRRHGLDIYRVGVEASLAYHILVLFIRNVRKRQRSDVR
jgi:hypothetical protein